MCYLCCGAGAWTFCSEIQGWTLVWGRGGQLTTAHTVFYDYVCHNLAISELIDGEKIENLILHLGWNCYKHGGKTDTSFAHL